MVVGASLGGLIALVTVGETPARIASRLILVDVTPMIDPEGEARIIGFMKAHPQGFASVEEAAEAVATYLPHRPRPSSTAGLKRNLRLGDDGRYYWHWDPRFLSYASRVGTGEALVDTDRAERAARNVRIPTLLVRGMQSDVISVESAQHLKKLIPHAETIEVSGAGHMVAGDRNDIFSDGVIRFLTKHYPAS